MTTGPSTGAGYSGTPLVRKLGIKPGHRVTLLRAPAGFSLAPVDGVTYGRRLSARTSYDVIVLFCASMAALEAGFAKAADALVADGALWVAWPKMTSGMATDLREPAVRDYGLRAGLVDVKICAIDATWSGLKFVYRVADRAARRS